MCRAHRRKDVSLEPGILPWVPVLGLACSIGCDPQHETRTETKPIARDLQIVAHEDDDVLFQNPDVVRAIKAGHSVRTVYVTAGDAGWPEWYWADRERGAEAAYARMAGQPADYAVEERVVSGRQIEQHTLSGASRISLIFLRLPDGGLDGNGSPLYRNESLQHLWDVTLPSTTTVDGANHYSRQDLIDVLGHLMAEFNPTAIRTLDGAGHFGYDNPDHRYSALFADEAFAKSSGAATLMAFRGYNVHPPFGSEPANLTTSEQEDKWATFLAYAAHDNKICNQDGAPCPPTGGYADYAERQYPFAPGLIVGLGGRCLDVADSAVIGSEPRMATCVSGPGQSWNLTSDGHLKTSSGLCVGTRDDGSADPTPLELAPCADASTQKWVATSTGELRLSIGKCMTVRGGTSEENIPIDAATCVDEVAARWRVYPP